MVERILLQSLPVNPDKIPNTFMDIIHHNNHICSVCSGSTLIYKGKAQWRHNKHGDLLCKKCYDADYRRTHKQEIDVSKLKVSKKGRGELTFVKQVKKPIKKITKTWDDLSFEKKQALRKRARDIVVKRFAKKFREIPTEEYFPYVTDLVAYNSNSGWSCNLCGGSTFYKPMIGFVIPNIKISDNTITLCLECLQKSYRLCKSLRANAQENGSLKNMISLRQQRN